MADYDAASTLKSICVMLGWMNIPPREVMEQEIRLLKLIKETNKLWAGKIFILSIWNDDSGSKDLIMPVKFTLEAAQGIAEGRAGKKLEWKSSNSHGACWWTHVPERPSAINFLIEEADIEQ